MKKLAVLFPGIGYTTHKPLLYYSIKLAAQHGYEIFEVKYGGFQYGIMGNSELMKRAAESAFLQAEDALSGIRWDEWDEVLFISKSVGTVVASEYMRKYSVPAKSISFTPVENTFPVRGEGIMFHGTDDPWVEKEDVIRNGCQVAGHELMTIEGGNHSLETGDLLQDIRILHDVMYKVEEYMNSLEGQEAEDVKVPRLKGIPAEMASEICADSGLKGIVVGGGETVTYTEPDGGEILPKNGTVLLFTE